MSDGEKAYAEKQKIVGLAWVGGFAVLCSVQGRPHWWLRVGQRSSGSDTCGYLGEGVLMCWEVQVQKPRGAKCTCSIHATALKWARWEQEGEGAMGTNYLNAQWLTTPAIYLAQ